MSGDVQDSFREIDASLITWIATANYAWLIAPTLRSLKKEFLIQMPTAEQSLMVAISVVAQAIKDSGINWSEPPDRRLHLMELAIEQRLRRCDNGESAGRSHTVEGGFPGRVASGELAGCTQPARHSPGGMP